MQAMRYVYAAAAFAFVLAVAWQVFLAGFALFGAPSWQWAAHVEFGYLAGAIPALLILCAWLSRAGRSEILLAVVTLVMAQVQTFLPLAREAIPWVAALHPVNAMVVFWLGVLLARRAFTLARSTENPLPATAQAAAAEEA
jgi:hypothetical protein